MKTDYRAEKVTLLVECEMGDHEILSELIEREDADRDTSEQRKGLCARAP
jgi:hypothetical protein